MKKKNEQEEVEFESIEDTEMPQKVIKELRQKIRDLEMEKSQIFASLQKTKADFINLRKSDEKEKSENLKYASVDTVLKVLPILDSLDNAIEHHKEDNSCEGFHSIKSQFIEALKSMGIEVENPEGKNFDPAYHDAVTTREVDSPEKDGIITSVMRVGYTIHGKAIRPPKVEVGQYKKKD